MAHEIFVKPHYKRNSFSDFLKIFRSIKKKEKLNKQLQGPSQPSAMKIFDIFGTIHR